MRTNKGCIKYEAARGVPHVREIGNAVRHKTGNWRVFKPSIDLEKCISCKICFTFCPDSAIQWKNKNGRKVPVIDYDVCKGCLICKNECPVKAISAERDMHEEDE